MQGLTNCLTFTVETEEDFEDGWLPTLDLKLRVNGVNQIVYSFFEKPTGSSKCLQANTALNQNCMMRSLNNEVMRRLANMSEHIPIVERVAVLDNFCQKMTNSGHLLEVVRRTMVSGIKGHLRKADRCRKEGKPFHRTAAASAKTRKIKKFMQKQSWFKTKPETSDPGEQAKNDKQTRGAGRSGQGTEKEQVNKVATKTKKMQPSTVLFCE